MEIGGGGYRENGVKCVDIEETNHSSHLKSFPPTVNLKKWGEIFKESMVFTTLHML